jgi:hypothetical protein
MAQRSREAKPMVRGERTRGQFNPDRSGLCAAMGMARNSPKRNVGAARIGADQWPRAEGKKLRAAERRRSGKARMIQVRPLKSEASVGMD